MQRFLATQTLLGLLLALTLPLSSSLAADGIDWQRAEREARGDLAAMLAVLRDARPVPQLRLRRPAAALAAALEQAGRFAELGLTPEEGRRLVDALYVKHGLDPSSARPFADGALIGEPAARSGGKEPLATRIDPPAGYVHGPEFAPLAAVLLRWPYDWSALRDEYVAMIRTITDAGAVAEVRLDNLLQQIQASFALRRGGVNLSKVRWVRERTDSVWMRDYGPIYLYGEDPEAWAVVDFHYYDSRPADDDTPVEVADRADKPVVDRQDELTLYTEGGNLSGNGLGALLYSERTYSRNPQLSEGETDARITSALNTTQPIVLPDPSLDGTGHVDMFSKVVGPSTVLVAQYDPDEVDYAVLEDAAARLQASTNGDGEPWQVVRIRQPDVTYDFFVLPIVRTYTNSLIVNDRVIVPVYGIGDDNGALAVYEDVFPNKTIVPLDAGDIIASGGAWHCVTMEFPRPAEAR